MTVDAYSHVCTQRLPDAISERHPGAGVAALRTSSYLFGGARRLRSLDRPGAGPQAPVLAHPPVWPSMPRPPLPGRPAGCSRHFPNDTMVNGSATAVRGGPEFPGATRVMYGTDVPMGPGGGEDWPVEGLGTIRPLDLSAAGKDRVPGDSLRRIMRL